MRVLLTGGAGRLGRHVYRYLKGLGHSVFSYDIADGNDLLDQKKIIRAARDCDLTIHFGGLSHPGMGTFAAYFQVNVWGTIHAYCAAREAYHRLLIVASSGAVYGWDLPGELRPQRSAIDEQTPVMENIAESYSYSKLACEHLLQAACQHDRRLPVFAMRLAPLWNVDQAPAEQFLYSALSPEVVCLVIEHLIEMKLPPEFVALNIADPWRCGGYSIAKAREMGLFSLNVSGGG